jgi:hypothetical protein
MSKLLLATKPSTIHISAQSRSLLPRISRDEMRRLIDQIDGTPEGPATKTWSADDLQKSERAWASARAKLVARARELRQDGMLDYPAATSLQSAGNRV